MQINGYNNFGVAFYGNITNNKRISNRFAPPNSLAGQVVRLDKKTTNKLLRENAKELKKEEQDRDLIGQYQKKLKLGIFAGGAVVVGDDYTPKSKKNPNGPSREITVAKFLTREEKIKLLGLNNAEFEIGMLMARFPAMSFERAEQKFEKAEDDLYKPGVIVESMPIENLDWVREATDKELKAVQPREDELAPGEEWTIKPKEMLN